MKLRLPLEKKFPPKLTREQLRFKANEELRQKGVENHLQAIINRNTLEEVLKSENPVFNMIRPSPKQCHKTQAWKIALEFVLDYVKAYQLSETNKTIHLELKEVGDPKSTGFFIKNNREEYFKKLQHVSKKLAYVTFEEKLIEFKKQQALVPPPELSLDPLSRESSSTKPSTQDNAPNSQEYSKDGSDTGSVASLHSYTSGRKSEASSQQINKSVESSKDREVELNSRGSSASKSSKREPPELIVSNQNSSEHTPTKPSTEESAHSEKSKPESPKSPNSNTYSYSQTPESSPRTPSLQKEDNPTSSPYSYSSQEKQSDEKKDDAPLSPSYSYASQEKNEKENHMTPTYSSQESKQSDEKKPEPAKDDTYEYSDDDIDSKPEPKKEEPKPADNEYSYSYSSDEIDSKPAEEKKPDPPKDDTYEYSYDDIDSKPEPKKEEPKADVEYSYTYSGDEIDSKPAEEKKPEPESYTSSGTAIDD